LEAKPQTRRLSFFDMADYAALHPPCALPKNKRWVNPDFALDLDWPIAFSSW
jgi:hypothetical protein